MSGDRHPHRRSGPRAALHALWLAGAACTAMPAAASGAKAPAITVSEPASFADLTREQTLMVDVYFGGVFRGEAMVQVTPGKLTFLDPQAVLRLFPEAQAADALAGLEQPLATNSDLACGQGSDPRSCGRLSPEELGIIFDRDRFRVDVFLNPRFLTVHDNIEEQYLPPPAGGVSAVNAIGGLLSGQSGPGADYYNLHDRLVVGDGERRVRADLSLASRIGFGAETLAFEWDRPERRYSAGAFWARGNDLSGRRKLLGVGVETQIDTRRDRDQITGSPVVVYLERRARVDVVRDGRVLSSAIYDAGNQQVDTSDLPEGSYEIVLRIEEAGQPAREERRFFNKSRRIPSLGRTDFFAFGGLLVDGFDSGSLEPSDHPYAEAGVAHRLSRHWALEGELQATDRGAGAEAGITFVTPIAQLRTAMVADTTGTWGGIVQLASTGNSPVNFNFDMRKIEGGRERAAPVPVSAFGSPWLDQSVTSYAQASGYVSYSVTSLRVMGTGIYRKVPGELASYSLGPAVEWDMLRKGPYQLTLHGDFAATERGNSAFAGLTLRVSSGRFSATAQGGGRTSTLAGDELGEGATGSLAGSYVADLAGGELALGAGYNHQPRQDDAIVSTEFRHPVATFAGEVVRSDAQGQPAVSQYSLGFQTTVTAGGGTVKVAGKTTTDSMIVVRVDGARAGDRFEVLVNEQVAGTIAGRHALSLALPTYRAYQVRIRPAAGDGLLAYDSSVRSVGLYPGAVESLRWSASPITIKLGRLVGPDGTPLAHASLVGKGTWGETDADGNFQIEAPDDAALTVTTADGRSYAITLPAPAGGGTIARLGNVACCTVAPVRLGLLDAKPSTRERAPQ
jgi:hypothetical protein